jgi:hypothetical protein
MMTDRRHCVMSGDGPNDVGGMGRRASDLWELCLLQLFHPPSFSSLRDRPVHLQLLILSIASLAILIPS